MFKETFKYYKRKVPPPDLRNVLDLSHQKYDISKVSLKGPHKVIFDNEEIILDKLGLIPIDQWKIYELKSHPGLIYVVNPFRPSGQRLWIYRALSLYPGPPNKLNLHAHSDLSTSEYWWQICQTNEERKIKLYKKLRWTTLGYHHNWDTKVYNETDKTEFPEDLKELSQTVVNIASGLVFEPQAAIINYYNIGSTLSGHTDHSEPNLEAPLLSLSFGQEAIFMIGGQHMEDSCEAIMVNSGDIVVMSGASRLCYHGVPLIRQTEKKPWNSKITEPDWFCDSWEPFEDYINSSRININVRQVLKTGSYRL